MIPLDLDGDHRAGAPPDPQPLPHLRQDLAGVFRLVLQVREDAASVHPAVARDRLEGHGPERRDVLCSPGVRPSDRLPHLHPAHPPADSAELPVHLFGRHPVGEVAHPQNRGLPLAAAAEFDLDASVPVENLVPVVGVGDELDDRVVDVPDGQLGVLHDAPRCDFQRSSRDCGHRRLVSWWA